MVAVLTLWRRSRTFAPFTIIANTALVVAGSLLFLMQMHLYMHDAYPDDFGFSTVNHLIDHYNNDIPSGDPDFNPPPKPSAPEVQAPAK